MPHQRPCDWEWILHISCTTSTLFQSIPWSMETAKVIQVGKPPSLRIMLWSLLPCCSLYIMIKAFHDCGWSNVTIGATSYFAAWLHRDKSLCSQDFLSLSQWQLGIGRWHACIIILVNVFFLTFWLKIGEGLLDVTRCCEVLLWNQDLHSDRILFLIPKM